MTTVVTQQQWITCGSQLKRDFILWIDKTSFSYRVVNWQQDITSQLTFLNWEDVISQHVYQLTTYDDRGYTTTINHMWFSIETRLHIINWQALLFISGGQLTTGNNFSIDVSQLRRRSFTTCLSIDNVWGLVNWYPTTIINWEALLFILGCQVKTGNTLSIDVSQLIKRNFTAGLSVDWLSIDRHSLS